MVDAVILWVDGSDPAHAEKLLQYSHSDQGLEPSATLPTRFADCNEIYYCINSIRKFAPFVDRIFLVTDDQCPKWLDDAEKERLNVTLINHKQLYQNHLGYLPVFNSRAIESMIHFIPDLAEEFIYFNDDFILVNHTTKDDFFVDGKPIIKGKMESIKSLPSKLMRELLYIPSCFLPWGTMGQGYMGIDHVKINGAHCPLRLAHVPLPILKSKMREELNRIDPDMFNASFRFRSKEQYKATARVAYCLLKQDKAILRDDAWRYTHLGKKMAHVVRATLASCKNKGIKSLCLQSLDEAPITTQAFTLKFLDDLIISK